MSISSASRRASAALSNGAGRPRGRVTAAMSFYDGLVRKAGGPIGVALSQQLGGDTLLALVARIEAVDEEVRVNQRGHGGTAPRGSNRSRSGRYARTVIVAPSGTAGSTRRMSASRMRRQPALTSWPTDPGVGVAWRASRVPPVHPGGSLG